MKEQSAKRRIIEGTIRCIEKLGIESVTIRAIAKESNVTLSSVHYYYHSKEALLDAAVKTAISGAMKDLYDIWPENSEDVFSGISGLLNYLFDGAIKFPGITKAGLYPMVFQNDTDSCFITELNVLLRRISVEIAKKLNMDPEETRIGLVELFCGVLLLGMSPSSFKTYLGYDFYEEKSRRLYVDTVIKIFSRTLEHDAPSEHPGRRS